MLCSRWLKAERNKVTLSSMHPGHSFLSPQRERNECLRLGILTVALLPIVKVDVGGTLHLGRSAVFIVMRQSDKIRTADLIVLGFDFIIKWIDNLRCDGFGPGGGPAVISRYRVAMPRRHGGNIVKFNALAFYIKTQS